jgi:hypothetical protein
MADEPREIKSHIVTTRRELGDNLQELEDRVKQATQWRTYVNRYPFAMVAIAFGGGVAASAMFGNSRSTSKPSGGTHVFGEKATELWDNLRGALAGLAATQIKSFLNDAIPGFTQHYEQMERQKAARYASQHIH